MITREQIALACYAILQGLQWTDGQLTGFTETDRKVKLFSDVDSSSQPWGGQGEHGEGISQNPAFLNKQVLKVTWVIYHQPNKSSTGCGATTNNAIMDAVVKAFTPAWSEPGGRFTLGNLVYHAYVNGNVFKDPGDLDGQAMMTIPITIVMP